MIFWVDKCLYDIKYSYLMQIICTLYDFKYSYISKSKVGEGNRGQPEGSLFNSYYTEV